MVRQQLLMKYVVSNVIASLLIHEILEFIMSFMKNEYSEIKISKETKHNENLN